MITLLLALSLSCFVLLITQNIWISLFFAFLLLIFSRKLFKIPFLLLFLLCIYRYQMDVQFDYFNQGRIVELNQSSVLIQNGFTKLLVTDLDVSQFSLADVIEVHDFKEFNETNNLFGFNLKNWADANHIIGQATYLKTIKKAPLIIRYLSYENASNEEFQMWYRHIVFQVQHDSTLGLLFSLGLLYTSLIRLIEKYFNSYKYSEYVIFAFIILLLFILGQPLSLIRIFVFRLCHKIFKRKDLSFYFSFIILFFIEPKGMTQMAWVIPLGLALVSVYAKSKYRKLESLNILSAMFLAFNLRFSLVFVFFYNVIRRFFPYLLALCFVARIFDFLQDSFVLLMDSLNHGINTLKAFGLISGHLSLLSLIMIIWVYQIKISEKKFIMFLSAIVFILNPLSILPFFNQITMINVGQGDSFLLQSAFNQDVILLDTGNTYALDQVQAALNYYGIQKIDVLSISHTDSDHSANLESIMSYINVNKIAQSEDIEFANTSLIQINPQTYNNDNDNSKVYYLNSEGIEFLFCADISMLVEKDLIKQYPNLKIDVLKLAHHGSKTSSSQDFLHQIEAKIALLSVGNNNYGHPSFEVIEHLNDYHIKMISTLSQGDSVLHFFRNFLWVKSAKSNLYMTFTK